MSTTFPTSKQTFVSHVDNDPGDLIDAPDINDPGDTIEAIQDVLGNNSADGLFPAGMDFANNKKLNFRETGGAAEAFLRMSDSDRFEIVGDDTDGNYSTVHIKGSEGGRGGKLKVYSDGDDKLLEIFHDDSNAKLVVSVGSLVLNPAAASNIIVTEAIRSDTTNTDSCGTSSRKWADVQSVLINGSDYGFANGFVIREYPCEPDDVQTKSDEWMREHASDGLQIRNTEDELIAVIHKSGTIYAKDFKPLSELK